jgi:hypothetical protein
MPTTIDDLIELVPPPGVPQNIPTPEEWKHYEAEFGYAFPSDYKQIITIYGEGRFANWIVLVPPRGIASSRNAGYNHLEMGLKNWEHPYAIFPQNEGLVLCGADDGNSFFAWQMIGLPDQWTLINFDNDFVEGSHVILNYSWLELLVGWFRGEIKNPRRGRGNQWYPSSLRPTQKRFFKQR